jgi:formylglycine-generating enzyme required for sulfatase activity
LADEGEAVACEVRATFWSEFEQKILGGQRGEAARRTAQQFVDQFVEIRAGKFQMGSPPYKQGMPADLRRQWKAYLEQEGDPAELAEEHVSRGSYSPGKAGQQARQDDIEWWTTLFEEHDLDALSQWLYPSDETPVKSTQKVNGFAFNRWPTINAWYRLFDPGHGLVDSWYREKYGEISPDEETPAIYISWYDAWAFCLWARWDGESCRLPHEHEWEYAAKAGTNWRWKYWWGDRFNKAKCNADQNVGRTTRPDPGHSNPFGLVDILGNVLEWTADEYRHEYSLVAPPDSSARVLRGGSWDFDTFFVRSACRGVNGPWFSVYSAGFRVARALQRKS